MVTSLSIRVDPVGVLRRVRGSREPDPAQVVVLAEMAGANGIAMAVRRDRRYMRERDMYMLREIVKTRLALELPPIEELIEKALEIKPWMVTLVADAADSESPPVGIDFSSVPIDLSEMTGRLCGAGIGACFLIEPEADDVKGAARAGATAVLLNCRDFSDARTMDQAQEALDRIDQAAETAAKSGLMVRAGGGLSLANVESLAELGYIQEFIIGHAVIARAISVGMVQAVTDFLRAVRSEPTARR